VQEALNGVVVEILVLTLPDNRIAQSLATVQASLLFFKITHIPNQTLLQFQSIATFFHPLLEFGPFGDQLFVHQGDTGSFFSAFGGVTVDFPARNQEQSAFVADEIFKNPFHIQGRVVIEFFKELLFGDSAF